MRRIKKVLFSLIISLLILNDIILIKSYAVEKIEDEINSTKITAQAAVGTKYQIKEEETWDISAKGNKQVIAKWTLKDKTLRITGSGDMEDWGGIFADDLHKKYVNIIANVVIEDGVTNIGSYAFYKCNSLKKVTIPSSVKSIGEQWGNYTVFERL